MTNRCDSVDAFMYAYCEYMRIKEENQMLEKNIDYIEFSMHSMMATHKPYQVAGIEITGSNPNGRDFIFGNNPFDIPCDVVVVPKKDFERLQASVVSHEKQDEEYLNFLKALFPDEDVEKLAWMTRQVCEPVVTRGAAQYWKDKCEQLQADLEFLKETVEEHKKEVKTLEDENKKLKGSLRRSNSTMLKELDQEIDKWQKATGCSTPEEAEKMVKSFLLTTLFF